MIPTLSVPQKQTETVEFTSFKKYIESHYQEDASKYDQELLQLTEFRNEIMDTPKNIKGRDVLYRYYGQLELLSLRFPIDEDGLVVDFVWKDAFTGQQVTQSSLAFEKASVLFNTAALCSSIAASADRVETMGLKTAYNYFQASAGLFQFINDNFLHPPSVDLSRESIKVLVDLMLAQAQECFIDKVLFENKSGNMVAKLAMHVSFTLGLVLEGFKDASVKNQFPRLWTEIITVKAKYYHALAHFHRSLVAEADNDYGQILAYLQVANKSAQEAIKLGTSFLSSFPAFLSGLESLVSPATPSAPSTTVAMDLLDLCKQLGTHINERLQIAIKDNDLIYHAPAIPADALPAIDKLNAVKLIPFHDLLPNGQKDIPAIVGHDLFYKLIPLGVHESSSVYSDSKDKILRNQKENVENADAELHVQMESLMILPALDQLKNALKQTPSNTIEMPQSLVESIKTVISEEEGISSLERLDKEADTGVASLQRSFDEISQLLDREQYECEQMRVKYMERWRQEPSSRLNANIKHEWARHGDTIQQIVKQTQYLSSKHIGMNLFLSTIKKPIDAVKDEFSIKCHGTFPRRKGSLLDTPIEEENGMSLLDEQILVEKLEGILLRLKTLKTERQSYFKELKEKIQNDDISATLLLNKGRESQVFSSELAKFKPLESKLDTNIEQHTLLIADLTKEFQNLKHSSKTLFKAETSQGRFKNLVADWEKDISSYFDLQSGFKGNIKLIQDTLLLLGNLRNTAVEFVNRRNSERSTMVQMVEGELAEAGNRALETQLNRLSVSSPGSGTLPNPVRSPGSYGPPPTNPPAFQSNFAPPRYANQSIPSPTSVTGYPTFATQQPSFSTQQPSFPNHNPNPQQNGNGYRPAAYPPVSSGLPPPNAYGNPQTVMNQGPPLPQKPNGFGYTPQNYNTSGYQPTFPGPVQPSYPQGHIYTQGHVPIQPSHPQAPMNPQPNYPQGPPQSYPQNPQFMQNQYPPQQPYPQQQQPQYPQQYPQQQQQYPPPRPAKNLLD